MTNMIRTLIVLGACVASLSAYAQEQKEQRKEVQKIIVRDGKVMRSENGGPWIVEGMGRGGYIGVQLSEMTAPLREYFRAPREMGVLVSEVAEGSPAAKAGLRVGDVITQIDGRKVGRSWDLRSAVREKKANEQVRVDFVRSGAPQHVFVAVEERERPMVDLRGLEHLDLSGIRIPPIEIDEEALERVQKRIDSPEFRARIESLGNCEHMEKKLKEIEGRMKELEKRLK